MRAILSNIVHSFVRGELRGQPSGGTDAVSTHRRKRGVDNVIDASVQRYVRAGNTLTRERSV